MFGLKQKAAALLCILLAAFAVSAQSRHNARSGDSEGTIINVVASRKDDSSGPIRIDDIFLYENGVEQRIRNFVLDPSPSRVVILVDNSLTVPADVENLKKAVLEFAYEIFEGDQLYVIAYDEKPEIISEWTDSAEKLETSLGLLRKKGNPHLFDAISAATREILLPLIPGTRKTAIVIIGDGLDRGSKTPFEEVLREAQELNIAIYAIQMEDRTGGAFKRNYPKASAVISKLTEGTGGLAFPMEEAQTAAKTICDELRKNRYLLSYSPINTSTYQPRRLLLLANGSISLRTKLEQPPNIK